LGALLTIYSHMPWRKGNRLRLVTEEQADDDTRRIYCEIREALGVRSMRLYYPAMGVYSTFLRLHWGAVKPIAQSEELFCAAERLRADAYTRTYNYFQIPDLSAYGGAPKQGAPSQLSVIADFYHYKEPLLLLLFCLQMQAMEGPAGQAGAVATPRAATGTLAEAPVLVEGDSPAATKKRLEEIRRMLALPFVNPEFAALARSPQFFDAYWETLKQMIASPLYDECRYGVRATAWALASQLPGPVELTPDQMVEAGMSVDEVGSVSRILEMFVANLSCQLLNVAAAKIALEGGNSVKSDRRQSKSAEDQPAA